jgi:hypothetical protein
LSPHAQVGEGVAEEVVLPKEQRLCSTSCVYRWLPPPLTFLGRWGGLEGPQQVVTLTREPLAATLGLVDWDAPHADIFQSPDSMAPEVKDQDVGVSGTELPRLSLL